MQCSQTNDFVLIGSGAGGSAAAGVLRTLSLDFAWFEAGQNMNEVLTHHPQQAYNQFDVPLWSVERLPELRTEDGRVLPYYIPKVVGGMTHHYEGVNFWTYKDTIASCQMSEEEEEQVLSFVKESTLTRVRCDAFDARYHTDHRTADQPAPSDKEFFSLNGCFYGACNSSSGCHLNSHAFGASEDWFKGSASTEYGTSGLQTGFTAEELIVDGRQVTGVRLQASNGTVLTACSRKAVLLAGGVMGDAHLLLPHVQEYKFFGQPYLVHYDADLLNRGGCDPQSQSGGTFFKMPQDNASSGFLSLFGACRVNNRTRLAFLAPEMVHPNMTGVILRENGKLVAQTNYNSDMEEQLLDDVEQATIHLFNVSIKDAFSVKSWSGGGWHWTGREDLSHRSRVRQFDNLYLADALGVTGVTTGWTSWNARVNGALAAYRAYKSTLPLECTSLRSEYQSHACCQKKETMDCKARYHAFQDKECCEAF